jgi:cell shape-determining protein MreD
MKYALLILSMCAAFAVEWIIGIATGSLVLSPPIVAGVALYWYGILPKGSRFAFALVIGFVVDSIGLLPFGTGIALYVLVAIFSNVMSQVFSHAKSLLARGVIFGIALFVFFLLQFPVAFLVGRVGAGHISWNNIIFGYQIIAAFLWALAFPIVVFGIWGLYRRMRSV